MHAERRNIEQPQKQPRKEEAEDAGGHKFSLTPQGRWPAEQRAELWARAIEVPGDAFSECGVFPYLVRCGGCPIRLAHDLFSKLPAMKC